MLREELLGRGGLGSKSVGRIKVVGNEELIQAVLKRVDLIVHEGMLELLVQGGLAKAHDDGVVSDLIANVQQWAAAFKLG